MMSDIFNRELSWLSFNHRVLQEANDPSVPLLERIKFLAIFSSNLDEFFRVRVASLRSLIDLKKKSRKKLKFEPANLLKDIHQKVNKMQNEFGEIFRGSIIPELNRNNIYILRDEEVKPTHLKFLNNYFQNEVVPGINTTLIAGDKISLFLKNNAIYIAVKLQPQSGKNGNRNNGTASKICKYAILEIPSDKPGRFVILPPEEGKQYVMFLDDVIRVNLQTVFPGYKVLESYSVKLTRDAELYIDDEFNGNLLEKIKSSLGKRKTGVPCRFLYDEAMPADFLKYLRKTLQLSKDDLIPGGRYHNFYDFFQFPDLGRKDLLYEPMIPLKCSELETEDLFGAINSRDVMVYYPYQSYDYVLRLLNTAAEDKNVRSIKITLYRTAKNSRIIKALVKAAENGKSVTAFIEVKARFDEELNFQNADELEKAGVKVLYSFPGLKVHSKMCLISREVEGSRKYYAYLSTGNFNEKTASIYSDIGLFTSDELITSELRKVFSFLSRKSEKEEFSTIAAAPFNLRDTINQLIDNETANAAAGKKALMVLKLNSIEDKKMINKLSNAAENGVKIKINVRDICGLKPDKKNNIQIRSIIDRYLEHSRIYYFYNGGDEKLFIASADFMKRNFDRRVELLIPVNNSSLKNELKQVLNIYFRDNVKARRINATQSNPFIKSRSLVKVRAQYEIYSVLKEENESKSNVSLQEFHRV
jgi:polyphosphate kinase